MKPEMEFITNTPKKEKPKLYTLTAGGTEYNFILHISMHSGTNDFFATR